MGVVEVLSKAVAADESAGCALIDSVVYDFVADLAEVNEAGIREEIGIWALDRVQVAKRTLGRSYVDTVSKGAYPQDDAQLAAEWLAGIEAFIVAAASGTVSKAAGDREWWMRNGRREQRTVSRDASGRFTRGVNQSGKKSNKPNPAERETLSPGLKNWSDGASWRSGMTDDAAARHQYQYEEATKFALEFKRALGGNGKDTDAVLMLQNPDGDIRMLHVPMDKVHEGVSGGPASMDVKGLRADDQILGVEVAPGRGASAATAARVAEFNLLGGAGGSQLAGLAMTDVNLRNQLKTSLKMPNASQDPSALSRLFGVMSAGGAVLGSVTGSEKVSQMAALVGEMGPQAEEVLGPYVKRSAYRYRGTEKTPDPQYRDPLGQLNVTQLEEVRRAFRDASPEAAGMHAIGDVAAGHLAETLQADPIIAQLSERSGRVLPSQGVMYDSKGRVVTQSVGFTDDHYLPFDLMNMGRLRGGQYVRTRQQGGLTGEDIYATVMSGARQAQVVSGSGVFTLEMAPDFRGARAMSDKARGMYDSYLKILDAVDESGLYLMDIPNKDKQALRAEAKDELGPGAASEDVKALSERKINAAREKAKEVGPDDELKVAAAALKEAGGTALQGESPMDAGSKLRGKARGIYENAYDDGMEAARATAANELRLNGQGYATALETLRQQFPYFIKDVTYRKLSDLPTDATRMRPGTREFTEDRGYAQPGSLRARGVRTGFYNPGSIKPGEKQQRNAPAAPAAEEKKETGPRTAGGTTTPVDADAKAEAAPERAPNVGMNKLMNTSAILEPSLKNSLGQLRVGLDSIPLHLKEMAAESQNGLPFASVASNKEAAVKWLLTTDDFKNVVSEMDGANAQKAAAALVDRDAIRGALSQILTSDGLDSADDFFTDGRTIGNKDVTNLEQAVDWMWNQGASIGDLVAMREGYAKMPSDPKAVNAHRGLMPLQMPAVAQIGSREQFDAFMEDPKNAAVSVAAALIAYEDNDMRGIAGMSEAAGEKLDSLETITAAQEKGRALAKTTDLRGVQLMTGDMWHDATGLGVSDEKGNYPAPSSAAVMSMDTEKLARDYQTAWSLAVASRVLDSLGGGSSWDLKEGDRTLEPVEKAVRRRRRPGPLAKEEAFQL